MHIVFHSAIIYLVIILLVICVSPNFFFFGVQKWLYCMKRNTMYVNKNLIIWKLQILTNWLIPSFLFCFVSCSFLFYLFFPFIFIIWRLITLQYCSGFCHTLTWISHGFTCIPHPNPPSHLLLHPILLGLPSAPGPITCLMHPAWAGDLFHPR